MSSSPERQLSPAADAQQSPHLPAGLLDSSPEMMASGLTAAISPTRAAISPTRAASSRPEALFTAREQQPRHIDVVMQSNEEFEEAIWNAMTRPRLLPTDQNAQQSVPVASSVGEPGPAVPSSQGQSTPQPRRRPQAVEPRTGERPATFLPPGHGRTPQQTEAAERLRVAVAARTRQQEEARSARSGRPAVVMAQNVNEDVHGNTRGGEQRSGPEEHQVQDWHQAQDQQEDHHVQQGHFPGYENPSQVPAEMPVLTHPNPHAYPYQQDPMAMPAQVSTMTGPPTYYQPSQPSPFPVPSNTSGLQELSIHGSQPPASTRNTVALVHEGDSIFSQMMNDLIADGRAENRVYVQIQLPPDRPTPFGREFLYFSEWIEPHHWLLSRAVGPRSVLRAIRNARNGDLVGWQDSESTRPGGISLFPTENPGRRAPGENQVRGSGRGRGRHRR